jgi:hypothetical protein
MRQIIIDVKDDKYGMFKAFLESLDYAKIISEQKASNKKEKVLKSVERGLKEAELIRKGKLKGTDLNDLLNEL